MENQPQNRVLLAEDNIFNQKVAVAMLKKFGLSADVASNGEQVLDQLSQTNYGLILMDCDMPKMDGYEATLKIREQEKNNGQHIPIVAMTAHESQEAREKCAQVGMDHYISKPFKVQELQTVLSQWHLIDSSN
jgi:CheY-like chemotaxis protein